MNNIDENNSFPTVDNMVVNDTPAESFDNIYGDNNVGVNQSNMVSENPFGVNMSEVPQNNNIGMNQSNMTPENPFGVNMSEVPQNNINNTVIDDKKMMSIEEQLSKTSQYNPEDFQQEKITIPTDNQYEKNKSGLMFIIILFVLLGVVIAFLPQITKLIK